MSALALSACKRDAQEAPTARVTTTSSDDALAPIVDEDYRIRLEVPGPGWKLAREPDIARLAPGAIAGAVHTSGLYGAVVVERAPGAPLEATARRVVDELAIDELRLEQLEPAAHGDAPAYRAHVRGSLTETPCEALLVVSERQGYVYQLLAMGPAAAFDRERAEAFLAAITFTDGPVQPRRATAGVDAQGVGWRVTAGVFESAVEGLRVAPPAGWRLVIGAELARVDGDADVALKSASPVVHLAVTGAPVAGRQQREHRAQILLDMRALGTRRDESFLVEALGAAIDFELIDTEAGDEHASGVHCTDDRCYHLHAWYPAAAREPALAALPDALGALALVDEPTRASWARALADTAGAQRLVGREHALRHGVYRHFRHRLRWRLPDGFWRVRPGRAGILVTAEDLASGARVSLVADADLGVDNQRYHTARIAALAQKRGFRAGDTAPLTIAGTEGLRTSGTITGRPHTLITATSGATTLELQLSGARFGADALDAALAGITFDATLVETEDVDGQFSDHRFGYALTPPPGDWKRGTLETEGATSVTRTWTDGEREIVIVATQALEPGDDEAWHMDFLEQMTRDRMGELLEGEPTPGAAEIAGVDGALPGRRLTWKRAGHTIDALLLRDGALVYLAIARGPTKDALGDALIAGLRLI